MPIQTTIKGILQNQQHQPIENAVVMITESDVAQNDIAAVSNEKGEFYLNDVTIPGKYLLLININGNAQKKEVSLTEGDTSFIITLK